MTTSTENTDSGLTPTVSVVIPAHNEEDYLPRCLDSIDVAAGRVAGRAGTSQKSVEKIVVLNRCTDRTRGIAEANGARCVNEDQRCIAAIRNTGVRASTAPFVLTIDADSWMSDNTIADALEHLNDERFIGGDTRTRPERLSLGIVMSVLSIAPYLIGRGISGGLFWFSREVFEELDGFDESLLSLEDLDFGMRLKALGKARGLDYGRLRKSHIKTSCRKFDQFGDWYFFKNPRLVRRLFTGADREAADHLYYDTTRGGDSRDR